MEIGLMKNKHYLRKQEQTSNMMAPRAVFGSLYKLLQKCPSPNVLSRDVVTMFFEIVVLFRLERSLAQRLGL